MFGFGHLYQGPAGMLLSGSLGAGLMAIYLGSGRNLWVAVIAHGTVDTTAFILIRAGLLA